MRMTYNGTMPFQLFMAFDCYERWMEKVFEATLSPGGTFVDVGAQIGFTASMASRHLRPGGRLVLIEPDPRALSQLRDHAQQLHGRGLHVSVHELAASGRRGELRLLLDKSIGHARLVYGSDGRAAPTTHVPLAPLDEVLGDLDATVDLLKLDVEGHELRALQGARRLLASGMVGSVLVECHSGLLAHNGYSPGHLAAFLEDLGFLGVRVEEGMPVTVRPAGPRKGRVILENWLFSRDTKLLQTFLPEALHPVSAFSSMARDWQRQCSEEASDPRHPEVVARRLIHSMEDFSLTEACAAAEELLTMHPRHWIRGHLAEWYRASGDREAARRHLSTVVEQNPGDTNAARELSRL